MVAYTASQRSKTEVDGAVRKLLDDTISVPEYQKNMKVFDEWRASHAYPMFVEQMYVRTQANKIEAGSIISQRLKRKSSILGKLNRMPDMRASRMQDIGGCRVIFKKIESVYRLRNVIKSRRSKLFEFHNEKDYIAEPKKSGYRGIHLVHKYKSGNIYIETQIRTHLQHLWATCVETAGTFTEHSLKTSQGPEEWLRFFCLVSSLFALKEGKPVTPNTSSNKQELITEIKELIDKYHFTTKLEGFNVAIRLMSDKIKGDGYYVLILNHINNSLRIGHFEKNDIDGALEMYNNYENVGDDNTNVVLVTATSIDTLKKAYPNYFMNAMEFLKTLKALLG